MVNQQNVRAKSYIAVKEARESIYRIGLLHRNKNLDDKQYTSLHFDCEELDRIIVSRCKKLDSEDRVKNVEE